MNESPIKRDLRLIEDHLIIVEKMLPTSGEGGGADQAYTEAWDNFRTSLFLMKRALGTIKQKRGA